MFLCTLYVSLLSCLYNNSTIVWSEIHLLTKQTNKTRQKQKKKKKKVCLTYIWQKRYIKGCGMGTLFVLVSPCFRENVVVTCKIGSFLCVCV